MDKEVKKNRQFDNRIKKTNGLFGLREEKGEARESRVELTRYQANFWPTLLYFPLLPLNPNGP